MKINLFFIKHQVSKDYFAGLFKHLCLAYSLSLLIRDLEKLLCVQFITNISLFDLLFVLVSIAPLPTTLPPDPPSLKRLPSLKNSNQAAVSSASPLTPVKGMTHPGRSENQSESAPLSPVDNDSVAAVGETQEGPIKPKRSAPAPPPSGKLSSNMHLNSIV